MKFDCRWLRLICWTAIVRYSTTPTSTSTRNVVPTASRLQEPTESTIQPTSSKTRSTIITTPSVIGQPTDLRRDMERLTHGGAKESLKLSLSEPECESS